ncbi:MAG: DMT family transporter [Gammaproteobacteria bacterium]
MTTRDIFIVVVINLIWGFNIVASKYGVGLVPPLFFTAMRFVILAVVLLPLLRMHKGQMKLLLSIAMTMGVLHFGIMFVGLSMAGDVSSVAIAIQLGIPFATILSVIFLGERLSIMRFIGILLAFGGVMIVGFDPVVFDYIGALMTVAFASLFGAIGLLLMKQLRNVGIFELQGWIATVSWPLLALASLFLEQNQVQMTMDASWWLWPTVLYTSLAASLLGHGGMYYLIGRYDISHVTPTFVLATVFAIIFGVTLLGDTLTARMLIGGVATLAGVLIILLHRGTPVSPTGGPVALPETRN